MSRRQPKCLSTLWKDKVILRPSKPRVSCERSLQGHWTLNTVITFSRVDDKMRNGKLISSTFRICWEIELSERVSETRNTFRIHSLRASRGLIVFREGGLEQTRVSNNDLFIARTLSPYLTDERLPKTERDLRKSTSPPPLHSLILSCQCSNKCNRTPRKCLPFESGPCLNSRSLLEKTQKNSMARKKTAFLTNECLKKLKRKA